MDDLSLIIDDYAGVMERLGGNKALLMRLLVKFHDNYLKSCDELEVFLSDGNMEEAHRLVHSIKGVSGNLGMDTLYRSSATLDILIKQGGKIPETAELSAFLRDMGHTLRELAVIFPER